MTFFNPNYKEKVRFGKAFGPNGLTGNVDRTLTWYGCS